MIIALVAATVTSAVMLVALHANQPKPKRVPVRTRDPRVVRRPND